jgi:hypothetical protein
MASLGGPVDTARGIQHPTIVVLFGRRLLAIAAVLTLCVGNLTLCGGWQAMPEARMVCCMSGNSCPMHKSGFHGPGSKRQRAISQVQADNCCAASSNGTRSSGARSAFVPTNATALPIATTVVVPITVPALQEWRALVPLPVSPVPKHLLLSVLLI